VPAWVFHGVKDHVVPFDDSVKMVTALQEAGARHVKFTQYEDTAHDAWTGALSLSLCVWCGVCVCVCVCVCVWT
jgi:succinate dehydrogenase/fumarate reductase-like Fe-S protein